MTFLAPTALIGLLLLALPILVHLLKPRKMRQTPFSSLRWLKQTRQRLSRRVQWHQWLLFLLRAGLIVLLVVALARPLLGGRRGEGPTDRFIIIDGSRGMAALNDDATAFERARELALKLAQQAAPGDRTAVLLAGGPPRLLVPLAADPGPHLAKVRAASVQASEGSVSSSLALLPTLLGAQPERAIEIIVLTSNARHAWRQSDVQALIQAYSEKLRVQVVDVGAEATSNAWITGARLVEREPGERLLRVELGSVGTEKQERSLRLTGITGFDDAAQEVTLVPGQVTRVDFRLPQGLAVFGQLAELRLEPGDALRDDDHFFLNLDTEWSLRVLLVEPASESANAAAKGRFLRTALDALAASSNDALRPVQRAANALTAKDLDECDIVVLLGVPGLSPENTRALEQRVRAGAGLIVFLGPDAEGEFYEQQLFKPLQPAEGLLSLAVKGGGVKAGGPTTLRQVRWSHPLLASMRDPLLSDLSLTQFLKYRPLDGTPVEENAVLARFDDNTPALVERSFGAGRVLLWNTTADDAWSDLPRRRSFVPLVDRMLTYLAAGGVRRQFIVGEPIALPVPSSDDGFTVVSPSGSQVPHRVVAAGSQTLLHLDAVVAPGVYRIEQRGAKERDLRLAVNVGRGASPLTPMDPKTLEAWWAPASFEQLDAEEARTRLDTQSSAWILWPVLLVLGGLLLLLETVYVYRLCPRGSPALVTPIVPRQGILKPVSERAS